MFFRTTNALVKPARIFVQDLTEDGKRGERIKDIKPLNGLGQDLQHFLPHIPVAY